MNPDFLQKRPTRREMLRRSAALAGSAFWAQLFPGSLLRAAVLASYHPLCFPPARLLLASLAVRYPLLTLAGDLLFP
jgi:hypothetical protein